MDENKNKEIREKMTQALLPRNSGRKTEDDEFLSCSYKNLIFGTLLLLGGLLYLQVSNTSSCQYSLSIVAPAYGYQSDTVPQIPAEPNWIKEETEEKICTPQDLVGALAINFDMSKVEERFKEMAVENEQFFENGEHMPKDCEVAPKKNIAIIIPFRDMTADLFRTKQFHYFLYYIVPILHRQNNHFAVYLVNQANDGSPFNRAKLLNIGFDVAKDDGFDCFFFHDVDLVPENDKNIYECLDTPRHYSGYIDKFNYKLPYNTIFGGITAFTTEAFEKINGYSNEYWGWGGEDDDLERRTIGGAKYKLVRPSPQITRYKMIKHDHETSNKPNPNRVKLLKAWNKHNQFDGLNSLNYELIERNNEVFYRNITVDLKYEERIPLQELLGNG